MPTRKDIREVLQLLASEEEQLEYERNVPHVDVTNELISIWFDDLYDVKHFEMHPALRDEERAALAEFHHFYDARVNRLPESQGTVRTWHSDPLWREVMQNAQATLEKIPA